MQLKKFWHVRVQLGSGSSASTVWIRTQNPDKQSKRKRRVVGMKAKPICLAFGIYLCTLLFSDYPYISSI